MTERERLIELLDELGVIVNVPGEVDEDGCGTYTIEGGEYVADHLLANGVLLVDTDVVCLVTNREPIRTALGMPLDELAELIRAKQYGRIIVPPCKVGDTVYAFCDCFGVILPYVVQNFGVGFMGKDRPNYWFWEATSHATETDELLDELDFDLDNIGKTVFLTKEEAEKALERSRQ